MKYSLIISTSFAALLSPTVAVPLAAPATTPAPDPNLVQGIINTLNAQPGADGIEKALSQIEAGLSSDFKDLNQIANAYAAVITEASQSKPAPTNVADASKTLESIFHTSPTDLAYPAAQLVLNNFKPKYNKGIAGQGSQAINGFNNTNIRNANPIVFPSKSKGDAPYSLSLDALREAIYFPPGYTYGEKTPVLLVPGTGSTGGDTFAGNFIPLLTGKDYADPVYLNVPGYLLADAQTNAEHIAYAINYISGVSKNKQIGVISWSQGGLGTQWAFKYWPSTRKIVKNFIPISPDFHGTVQAHILCPGFPVLPCPPSVVQQENNSTFVRTLLAGGGDSAYVPTTTVYSSFFDEIVQPQTGTGASAFLKNAHGAGVTNNEVQAICPGQPAGSFFTHEGVLYNPLAFYLAQDALQHGGPGQISRLDLESICQQYAADGLSILDVLDTEATIPQALLNILFYFPKSLTEPALQAYAK